MATISPSSMSCTRWLSRWKAAIDGRGRPRRWRLQRRALEAGADEQARVGSVDHDEREVALELGIRLLDGGDEVAHVVISTMDDHLCVGLE